MMTDDNARPMPAARLAVAATLALVSGPALAAGLEFEVTLPQPEASPAYRPYLAAWIEEPGSKEIRGTVAVWYDTRLRDNLGRGFLRDLRSWWRAEGEKLDLPADGLSGPTRGPGTHKVAVAPENAALAGLSAGDYVLAVEVSREDGGRETLRAPFSWGGAENSAEVTGEREITRFKVTATP